MGQAIWLAGHTAVTGLLTCMSDVVNGGVYWFKPDLQSGMTLSLAQVQYKITAKSPTLNRALLRVLHEMRPWRARSVGQVNQL